MFQHTYTEETYGLIFIPIYTKIMVEENLSYKNKCLKQTTGSADLRA